MRFVSRKMFLEILTYDISVSYKKIRFIQTQTAVATLMNISSPNIHLIYKNTQSNTHNTFMLLL